MDRRLVGFVAIIVVATTVITGMIYQITEEEPVQILASRTPDDVPGGRPGAPSYSMDVLSVKDLPDLVIGFRFLINLTTIELVKMWNETAERDLEDLVANVPRIAGLLEHLDRLSARYGIKTYETYEVEIPNLKLHVFDFSEVASALGGQSVLKEMYTVYAFGIGPGDRVSVMAGYRDFFVYPRDHALTGFNVLSEVRFSSPAGSSCFSSPEAPGAGEGCGPLDSAPVGTLWFKDLRAGESIHVEVTLNTIRMFGHSGIVQFVTTKTGHGTGPILAKVIGARAS